MRCLIVDDSTSFLEAARTLLERQGIAVVGVATTTAEALKLAEELRPDVTLVDIDLGRESGFELVQRRERETSVAPSSVILISSHAEEDFADLIVTAPVAGFLSKSRLSADTIQDVLGDEGMGDG